MLEYWNNGMAPFGQILRWSHKDTQSDTKKKIKNTLPQQKRKWIKK
jgi:hypothetical protein